MWQLKAPHCADSLATCQNDLAYKCGCPVIDFVGGTEERSAATEREVAAIQESKNCL